MSAATREQARYVTREFHRRTASVECSECGRWERACALKCRWCGFTPGSGKTLRKERDARTCAVWSALLLVFAFLTLWLLVPNEHASAKPTGEVVGNP